MDPRRRLRFSLRRLLGFVTLVGLSLALWTACQQRAISDLKEVSGGWTPSVVMPYVLKVSKSDNVTVRNTYHVWFCGLTAQLPYSSEHPETGGYIITVRPRIIFQPEEEELAMGFDPQR